MVKIIKLNKSVYEDNNRRAELLREYLRQKGVFLVNVMSSPGAGKTTTLIALINRLCKTYRVGVMEADIDSDVDARKIADCTSCKAIQLHTGGMCHLDADMTRQGLDELGIEDVDVVFLENVGNLVCPAEFDTGALLNMLIASVPEGDDKPIKYPLAFGTSQLVVLNKTDALPYFDFDCQKFLHNVEIRNKNATVISVSAKTQQNMDAVADYLSQAISQFKENPDARTKR